MLVKEKPLERAVSVSGSIKCLDPMGVWWINNTEIAGKYIKNSHIVDAFIRCEKKILTLNITSLATSAFYVDVLSHDDPNSSQGN